MDIARALRIWYRKRLSSTVRLLIYRVTVLALIIIAEIALIFIAADLTSLKLIDWTIVISFFAVELLAVIVARMLGVGKEPEDEVSYRKLQLASLRESLMPKYGHLEIVCLRGEDEEYPEYPKSVYYVINSGTLSAYWSDRFLCDLMQDGVIKHQVFDDAASLEKHLAKIKVTPKKRYPEGDELQPFSIPEKIDVI
jgi:hypothetical protein